MPFISRYRCVRLVMPVFMALLLFSTDCPALDVPVLKGRVNDYAGVLSSSTEKGLETVLGDLERTDSTQIVVLTVPSLEGDSLEAFSMKVAEDWKIGQKGYDNGAILLISKNDRKLRIEAGYGLEGRLTDLVSGRIIRDIIVPHFRTGNYDNGVSEGVQAMIAAVRGEFTAVSEPQTGSRDEFSALFPVIIFLIIFLINIFARFRNGTGSGRSGSGFFIAGSGLSGRGGSSSGFGGFSGGGGGFGGGGSSGSW